MRNILSIRFLMLVAILVAADFRIVRALLDVSWAMIVVLTLPTFNFVVLDLRGGIRGEVSRPNQVGFAVGGVLAMVVIATVLWNFDRMMMSPMWAIRAHIKARGFVGANAMVILITASILIYTPPQLLIAWIGGKLADRWWSSDRETIYI